MSLRSTFFVGIILLATFFVYQYISSAEQRTEQTGRTGASRWSREAAERLFNSGLQTQLTSGEVEWSNQEELLPFDSIKQHFLSRFKEVCCKWRDNQGEVDIVAVAWAVAPIKLRYDPSTLFAVDIGANVGQTSRIILNAFNNLQCRTDLTQDLGEIPLVHLCGTTADFMRVIAFEPMPENLKLLENEKDKNKWNELNWEVQALAVSSKPGQLSFYTNNNPGELGKIQEDNSIKNQKAMVVNVTTLDYFVQQDEDLRGRIPFLVKIDAEGFDPEVIQGAKSLLSEKRIKFLVFEYNLKWFQSLEDNGSSSVKIDNEEAQHKTLLAVTKQLDSNGYICFFLFKEVVIPVSPLFWHDSYELKLKSWNNIFCGRGSDMEMLEAVMRMQPDPTDRRHLLHAFQHLQRY